MLDNFDSGDLLYVDANGLEMQEKTLNERREFSLNTSNLIASNFYPITSAISIRDQNSQNRRHLTIMTERSHAASAGLRGSNIEIMV